MRRRSQRAGGPRSPRAPSAPAAPSAVTSVSGLEIVRWAHGGEGVGIPREGALAGRVVFVPEVVPGDVVDVALSEVKARWARGRVRRIVRPSAARVPVPCAVQARCGGCPWMPGSAEAQGLSRRAILVGELKKRLGLGEEAIAARLEMRESPVRFGYRQRVRLRFEVDPRGEVTLGFTKQGSHTLVAIARCEVADERINAALPMVRRALSEMAGGQALAGRVTLVVGVEGVAGHVEARDGRELHLGPERVTLELGEHRQAVAPEGFVQANAQVTGQMLATLTAWAGEERRHHDGDPWAVELFAGAGTLTLALWRCGWRVVAYEVSERARPGFEHTRIASAQPPERARWHACDLALGLPLPAPPAPALIVLDPPRTGAADVIGWIRGAGARAVVYVSCDLATGLRDVAALAAGGRYEVARVVGLDMFPHTAHQEVMFLLRAMDRPAG